jgi:hypothetical protein
MIELLIDRLKFDNEKYNPKIKIKYLRTVDVEKLIKLEFILIGK